MPGKTTSSPNKILVIAGLSIVVIAVVIGVLTFRGKNAPQPEKTPSPSAVQPESTAEPETVIDYNELKKDNNLNNLMKDRKAKYGIENGIDVVVRADESLKVGNKTIAMQKILDEARLRQGDLIEKDMAAPGNTDSGKDVEELGVYVVQKGDNIWNIHFRLLKDYFDRRGIPISPVSDEPDKNGTSSGVGKILKFSENIVSIYNLQDETLDKEINILQPLSKIVVYRMGEVFALLDQIDYKNVNHIQFDGEVLWVPGDH